MGPGWDPRGGSWLEASAGDPGLGAWLGAWPGVLAGSPGWDPGWGLWLWILAEGPGCEPWPGALVVSSGWEFCLGIPAADPG